MFPLKIFFARFKDEYIGYKRKPKLHKYILLVFMWDTYTASQTCIDKKHIPKWCLHAEEQKSLYRSATQFFEKKKKKETCQATSC